MSHYRSLSKPIVNERLDPVRREEREYFYKSVHP
jgi:hypothetical protein